jgi:hypothetical protein
VHEMGVVQQVVEIAAEALDQPFGRCGCGSSELDWLAGDELKIINPRLEVFQVSATRGDGLESWYGWLADRLIALRSPLREVHAAG